MRRHAMLLATTIAVLTAACDTTGRDSSAPAPETGKASREQTVPRLPAPVPPPIAGEPATTGSMALAPGTFEVRLQAGNVSILANNAPVLDILDELAQRAGFEVEGTGAAPVTLNLQAGSIHAAVAELLKPGPYEIVYTYDSVRGQDALTRVVVGQPAARKTAAIPPPLAESADNLPGAPLPDAGETELAPEDQALLSLLLDPSPEVRVDAAESIEASGIALDYLGRLLTTDPSPEVRMAATYSLENSEDPRAVDTLIQGLGDADPEVLVEVIDSLSFLDDRRAIPYLQPLLTHPDEEVRDAAEAAIQALR